MRPTPDIARLSVAGATVAHCRLPAWEAGGYFSQSAGGSIGVSFTGQSCVVDLAGRTTVREIQPSSVVVTGLEPVTWLRVDRPSELVEVSAAENLRHEVADELCVDSAADLATLELPEDPAAWAICAQLRTLARSFSGADGLAVEYLIRLLYGQILLTRFGGRLRYKGDGALDRRRLARVVEYVDANLGSTLSLSLLAEIAALSPFHFQRSFRRAMGCSPHRYVALRRADRASHAVRSGREVREIATKLGYSSVSQMRTAIRGM